MIDILLVEKTHTSNLYLSPPLSGEPIQSVRVPCSQRSAQLEMKAAGSKTEGIAAQPTL